jgi:hypothetical protein
MRITSAGNVGIGTTTPAEKLSVSGAIMSTGAITGHGANRTTLSQEGSNGAYWQSYGADASTVGTFNLRQASSDFSIVRTPLSISSTGAATFRSSVTANGTLTVNEDGASTKIITIRSNWAGVDPAINVTTNNSLLLMTNNTERMRITSAGNVGIGTTSPNTKLHTAGSLTVDDIIYLQRASSSLFLPIANYWNGSGNPLAGTKGDILAIGNAGGDGLVFVNSNTERMRIDGNGATFASGVSLNSATAPASGIEFPATQVASASANNLDDYEEGTWTPSLGGTTTYTAQGGTYTKIGRQVTINFLIGVNILGTGSSSVITGVPFTVNSTNRGSGGVAYVEAPVVAYASINPAVLTSTTQLIFATSTILGAWADQSNVFTNGTIISGTVTYFV